LLKKLILHLIAIIGLGSSGALAKDSPCTNLSLTAGATPFPIFIEVSLESHCFRAYGVASPFDPSVLRAMDYMIPLNRNFVFGAGVGAVNFQKTAVAFSQATGRHENIQSNYRAYGPVIRLDYFTEPSRPHFFGKFSIVGGFQGLHTEEVDFDWDLEAHFDKAEQARLEQDLGPKAGGDQYVFGLIVSWGLFL
jgi:hypothetical protein